MSALNITLDQRRVFEAYEDSIAEGETLDVKAVASVVTVYPSDILVIEVEVGNMPGARVKEHLDMVKGAFVGMFPKGTQVMFVPMKDGKPSINFKALRFDKVDER